ncbi:MAG: hypothetical protein ACK4SL_01690 [Candidatus Paceibacteria bacterium]
MLYSIDRQLPICGESHGRTPRTPRPPTHRLSFKKTSTGKATKPVTPDADTLDDNDARLEAARQAAAAAAALPRRNPGGTFPAGGGAGGTERATSSSQSRAQQTDLD